MRTTLMLSGPTNPLISRTPRCGSGVLGLTADATAAYWVTSGQFGSMGDSDILAAPFAGGPPQKIACQFRMYGGIAVDDTDVYFVSEGSTVIAKVPKHGG
jgi:hypothetical protein